jgi:hypothetical protein
MRLPTASHSASCRPAALLLVAALCSWCQPGQGAELLARGVILPTFVAELPQAVAVTRVAFVEKDYYRRGFLQFGMLPITVGREVVMEVLRSEALAAALADIQGWEKAPGRGRAVELRGFSLRVLLAGGQRELTAGRVRFGEQGQVVLAEGVVWQEAAGAVWNAEEAVLQTTGPDTGWLVLRTESGPVKRQIFGLTSSSKEETLKPSSN